MSHERVLVVLVVEDDFAIRRLLDNALGEHGMSVLTSGSLSEARAALATQQVDLIMLDLGLPDGDGIAFISELRAWSTLPVLVLSARSQERDKIAALDAGADDYLGKPFASGELLARIRALTRRSVAEHTDNVVVCGELRIEFAARRVLRAGSAVHLTPNEFHVLTLLAAHPGKVLTYRWLLAQVWGSARIDQHHYVRVIVGHLRQKLERDPAQPRHLLTETGVGYRWQP